MKLTDLLEADSQWVKEDFENWFIIANKTPLPNGQFSAAAKYKRNPNIMYKAEGGSIPAAITAVKLLVTTPDHPLVGSKSIAFNFNVEFTSQHLNQHAPPYYFTAQQINDDIFLVMAGEYFAKEPEEIKKMGYREAFARLSTEITDRGATQAWSVAIPTEVSRDLKIIFNARYQIDDPMVDNLGNYKFKLSFVNTTKSPFDKQRLPNPALTVVPRK